MSFRQHYYLDGSLNNTEVFTDCTEQTHDVYNIACFLLFHSTSVRVCTETAQNKELAPFKQLSLGMSQYVQDIRIKSKYSRGQ